MSSPGDGTGESGSDDGAEDGRRPDGADDGETPVSDGNESPTTGDHGTAPADGAGTPADGGDQTPDRDGWRSEERAEPPQRRGTDEEPSEWILFAHDLASSVLAVLVVGAYLFAVSGVWPPLVAVESRSMDPNMQVNDLVFVMEEDRFPGENAHGQTGVVTARAAEDYRKFGRSGDVIVFAPNGNGQTTPIIHRAMFWVEDGENWYEMADEDYVGDARACETDGDPDTDTGLKNCPAPHAGFITKGDNNPIYDQAGFGGARTGPVRPEWVVGTAEVRIPGLGWVRLATQ